MTKSKIFLQLCTNLVGVTIKLRVDTFLKSREVSKLITQDDFSHDDKKMFKSFSRKMIYETSKVPLVSTDVAQYSKAFETRTAVE